MKTRKETYADVVKLGLQDEVKRVFGRNFTQVSTEKLENLIATKKIAAAPPKPRIKKADGTILKRKTKLDVLISILSRKNILLKSELAELEQVK